MRFGGRKKNFSRPTMFFLRVIRNSVRLFFSWPKQFKFCFLQPVKIQAGQKKKKKKKDSSQLAQLQHLPRFLFFLNVASLGIILFRGLKTKVLIRLGRCTGWSGQVGQVFSQLSILGQRP